MSENRAESEYSLQYFGFSPEEFSRDFSELALEEMSGIIKSCITELADTDCPLESKEEFRQEVVEMHHQWCNKTEVLLSKLEPDIKSFFTIPQNVLLDSDLICKTTYTEEEVETLKNEVAELEESYKEHVKELSLMEAVLSSLNALQPLAAVIDEAAAALEPIPITINELKNFKKVAATYLDKRSELLRDESDDSSDERESIAIHVHKFKTIEE